jgi:Flp pilus assembly protein TadG
MSALRNSMLLRLLRCFRADERGIALVESAFIFPICILMLVGGIAVTNAIATDRKVTLVTRAVGDIIAQDTAVTQADIDEVFAAGALVMAPFAADTTTLKMRVSSVHVNNAGTQARVCWSFATSGFPAQAQKQLMALPADLMIPNSFLIVPETEYEYTPIVGEDVTGVLTLNDILYMRPRQVNEITAFNGVSPPEC